MQLHQIKPKTKLKGKKIIGRGGKRGTYSGKGMKGQQSRAGNSKRPEMRDIIKRMPKKRGYAFISHAIKPFGVNLNALERVFKDNDEITPKTLIKAGLVKLTKGKTPAVKLLGTGEITKKISVSGCQTSKSAKEKIEKAGGNIVTKN
jgi:large subunit ribosomal protein L15